MQLKLCLKLPVLGAKLTVQLKLYLELVYCTVKVLLRLAHCAFKLVFGSSLLYSYNKVVFGTILLYS